MNLKDGLKNKMKKEKALTHYLREYCGVSNARLYQINQAYIDFLLKYNTDYLKDIESFLNHDTSFLLDGLLNLKMLSPTHLEKIYLSQLNFKQGRMENKGYFFFNDPNFNFEFISKLFNEVLQIKAKEKLLWEYVVGRYKEYLWEEKIKKDRKQIELHFLKQSSLLDADEKTRREVLGQQKALIDRKLDEFILKNYQVDIKEKILEDMGYSKMGKLISEKEELFLYLKKYLLGDYRFDKLEDLQSKISKIDSSTLKNTLYKVFNKIYLITLFHFFYENNKIWELYDNIITWKKEEIKKIKDKETKKEAEAKLQEFIEHKKRLEKIFKEIPNYKKELDKLIDLLIDNEFVFLNLFEYLNIHNISLGSLLNKEEQKGSNFLEKDGFKLTFNNEKVSNIFSIFEWDISWLQNYDELTMSQIFMENQEVYKNFINKKNFFENNKNKIWKESLKVLEEFFTSLSKLEEIGWITSFSSFEKKKELLIANDFEKDFEKMIEVFLRNNKEFNKKDSFLKYIKYNLNIFKKQKHIKEFYFKEKIDNVNYENILAKNYLLGKYKNLLWHYETILLNNDLFEDYLVNLFENFNISLEQNVKLSDIRKQLKEKEKEIKAFLYNDEKTKALVENKNLDLYKYYLLAFYVKNFKSIVETLDIYNKMSEKEQKNFKKQNKALFDIIEEIYKRLIQEEEFIFKSFFLDYLEEEKVLKYYNRQSINLLLAYYKIDKFIFSFFLSSWNINDIKKYITYITKSVLFINNKHLVNYDLLSSDDFLNVLEKNNITSIKLLKLGENIVEYIREYKDLWEKLELGTINMEQYDATLKATKDRYIKKDKLFEKIIAYFDIIIKEDNVIPKEDDFSKYLNSIFNSFLDYKKEANNFKDNTFKVLNIIGDKKAKNIFSMMSNITNIIENIDQVEKIDLVFLIYHIVMSNVVIENWDNYLTVAIWSKVFVILSQVTMNTLNNAILFVEDKYKNSEHIFVFVNADIFYYIFDKISSKLAIFWVSVLTRNILSYMYFHKKISDLDFFGSKKKNYSRIKMRINWTYKNIVWRNWEQDQTMFTFNELENFITDMFTLWATIWDTAVEDLGFSIGWVEQRTNIMRDGDRVSISIRKTEHIDTTYEGLKQPEVEEKLKNLFGLYPTVKKIPSPSPDVTLEMSYSKEDVELMKAYAEQDRWIFLIIWKTRSWKSTSIRNLLDYIFDSSLDKGKVVKILTFEDPIESQNLNYNQIQVKSNPEAFQQMIKWVKRQDPDLLLIWEIRDATTLLQTNELANMMSTFSTMHITNPLDGLFTLKWYAVQNNIDLMDIVNVLKIIVSQKLLNKIDNEKVEAVIEDIWIDYFKLREEGIFIFKDRAEIEDFLSAIAIDWLESTLQKPIAVIYKEYEEGKLNKDDTLFVEGYKLFEEKTWKLYNEKGYLIRDLNEKFTKPKLYYDYLHNKFINANLDLILRLSDKDTPIKQVKDLFVSSFELKEEKALMDYFAGELPFYWEGLNKLDTPFYPYILKKIVKTLKATKGM